MKNISLTLLCIALMTTSANAQFAVEGGLNLANLSMKSDDVKLQTKFKKGIDIGISVDLAMGSEEHVYFEPGLFYIMNGCTSVDGASQPTADYVINTIVIPMNIQYKTGNKCGGRFFIGAGVFFASNIGGTYAIDAPGTTQGVAGDLIIGSNPGASLKQIDFGLGANMGYILKNRWFIRVRYQQGFANLLPGGDNKNYIKTSSIGITLGKAFGKCHERGGGGAFGVRKSNHWRGLSKGIYSTRPKPPRYPRLNTE